MRSNDWDESNLDIPVTLHALALALSIGHAAPGGTFVGSPQGCDANLDQQIDAGDILCTVLTIFQGQDACHRGDSIASSTSAAPATLTIPDDLRVQPGNLVTVPVNFMANGNATAAAVFAITFDPAVLQLDPTDRDGNGIPDAISFSLAGGRCR